MGQTTGQYPAQPGELYMIIVTADAFRASSQPFRDKAAGLDVVAASRIALDDLGGMVVCATNLAFAVELYVKGFRRMYGQEPKFDHSLKALYDDLPQDLAQSIEAMYDAAPKPIASIGFDVTMGAPTPAPVSDHSLASVLDRSSALFEKWRYLYEAGKKPMFEFYYLGIVADVMHVHAQRFIQERLTVTRGGGRGEAMTTTRYLPLREGDAPHWALLTCPREGHTAGDVELKREGAFTEVRCRECARDGGATSR